MVQVFMISQCRINICQFSFEEQTMKDGVRIWFMSRLTDDLLKNKKYCRSNMKVSELNFLLLVKILIN